MTRVTLCAADAVADGEAIAVEAGGQRYGVAKDNGTIYVFDDKCPHAGASLGDEGCVDGPFIECSWHEARFDMRSGALVDGPAEADIRCYPVSIVDGRVEIER